MTAPEVGSDVRWEWWAPGREQGDPAGATSYWEMEGRGTVVALDPTRPDSVLVEKDDGSREWIRVQQIENKRLIDEKRAREKAEWEARPKDTTVYSCVSYG